MSFAVLFGLFVLKHALLSHVVDFGYSLSRSSTHRFWYLGIAGNTAAEAVVSMYLLFQYSWKDAAAVLLVEHIALLASSVVERRAPVTKLLQIHVYCEVFVLLTYCLALSVLVARAS